MSTEIPGDEPAGFDRLAEALLALDVEVVFGLPGVHNLRAWHALQERGIRLIGVRHEQTAAYAADGYARASGRLGVALVTTGPGATNTLTATGEAFSVGSPVLILATDIATTVRRAGVFRGALHECVDQTGMFRPVTKWASVSEHSERVGADTLAAGRRALQAPTRPVYLGIPVDVLEGPAPDPLDRREPVEAVVGPSPAEVVSAAALVNAAETPLIWIGGGAVSSGAGRQIAALAEVTGAAVMSTYKAKGALSYRHPQVLVSPPQVPLAEQMWDDSDLVIAIGTDFDAMMTRAWRMKAPRKLLAVNVDREDATKNYPATQVLVGDACLVLERLLPELVASGHNARTAAHVADVDQRVWDEATDECPEATAFLDVLTSVLPTDANLVADMCVAGYWVGGFCRVEVERKLAYPVGWGTLGFALPAAVGTSAAATGPTVVIVGDGGFLYASGELATIVQQELPMTIVVVDDGGYGMLRFAQDLFGVPNKGVDLHTPRFDALAESFGLECRRVIGLGDEFSAALADGVSSGRPNLIWAQARLLPPPNTSTRAATIGARK
jgi:thiamine pyrophosphate-dependent acetolactate synthase large subunit-like protein